MENKINKLADGNLEYIDAVFRFVTYSENWKFNAPPFMPYDMLLYIISGEAFFEFNNEKYHVYPNNIVFIPAGTKFNSRGIKDIFDYYCIQFSFSKTTPKIPFKRIYDASLSSDYYIYLFEKMYDSWLSKKVGYILTIKSIFYKISARIMTDDSFSDKDIKKLSVINKSVKYLESNLCNPDLSIEDIAKVSDITSAHFRNLFKDIFNISPVKYINNMRIKKACDLLEYSNIQVREIAEMCGFSNIYHFHRDFKKMKGCTPLEYRKESSVEFISK